MKTWIIASVIVGLLLVGGIALTGLGFAKNSDIPSQTKSCSCGCGSEGCGCGGTGSCLKNGCSNESCGCGSGEKCSCGSSCGCGK